MMNFSNKIVWLGHVLHDSDHDNLGRIFVGLLFSCFQDLYVYSITLNNFACFTVVVCYCSCASV